MVWIHSRDRKWGKAKGSSLYRFSFKRRKSSLCNVVGFLQLPFLLYLAARGVFFCLDRSELQPDLKVIAHVLRFFAKGQYFRFLHT